MKSAKAQKRLSKWIVNGTLLLLVLIWTIPTLGIFISSFRERNDIATTGWWLVFPHREWQTVKTINPKDLNLDPTGIMNPGVLLDRQPPDPNAMHLADRGAVSGGTTRPIPASARTSG
jgi:hypothetical protein